MQQVRLINKGRLLACGTPEEVKKLMSGTIMEIRSSEPRRAMAVLREQLQADSVGLFGDCVHVVTHEPDKTITQSKEALMRQVSNLTASSYRSFT